VSLNYDADGDILNILILAFQQTWTSFFWDIVYISGVCLLLANAGRFCRNFQGMVPSYGMLMGKLSVSCREYFLRCLFVISCVIVIDLNFDRSPVFQQWYYWIWYLFYGPLIRTLHAFCFQEVYFILNLEYDSLCLCFWFNWCFVVGEFLTTRPAEKVTQFDK